MNRSTLALLSILTLSGTHNAMAEQLVPRRMQGQPKAASALPAAPAFKSPQAERVTPAGTTKRRAPVRRLASVESSSLRTRTKTAKNPEGYQYRIGIVGGLGSMSSGYESNQLYREEYQLGKNLIFGLQADLRFMKYFGVELDSFYGLAPTRTVEYSALGSSDKTSLQQLGGLLNLKTQYPFYTGSIRWTPKFGLGYGYMALKNKLELASGTKYDINETMSGPFATIGFEVEPIHAVVVMLDYARSVATSGKVVVNDNSETTLEGASFTRIRAGAYYRAFDHIMLGGQYIMRSMNSSTDFTDGSGGVSGKESSSQMLGSVLFEF